MARHTNSMYVLSLILKVTIYHKTNNFHAFRKKFVVQFKIVPLIKFLNYSKELNDNSS